ncbi:MAG: hypothetical protein K2L79_02355, partial [Bacteroidales bacterium]|nr:hypothetical protein [Bacteroidales bacterium]
MVYRFFSNLKHYWGYWLLNMLSNVGFVCFSLFSLSMLAPFLSVLFSLTSDVETLPEHFSFDTQSIINNSEPTQRTPIS